MYQFNLLSTLLLQPIIGAIIIALLFRANSNFSNKYIRPFTLFITIINFIISLSLYYHFDRNSSGFQFVEKYDWIKQYGISYHLGVDGISIYFVLLTTFLMPLCILTGWKGINERLKEYMISFLLLESMVIGVFCALDLVLFYIFFEAVLIPMFLIIGIWGGDNRIYAAFKFFLYTLTGSVLFLIAVIYIYKETKTTDVTLLAPLVSHFTLSVQKWLWLAFFASFAVKVPMWPFHTWLPDAHVQAPTAGSVILAGVLLKLGGYGFIRFSLPLLPEASHYFTPLMFGLSIVAIIYTSLVALIQEDMKKLIAYSSVAHMGFVTLGIFAMNRQGIDGAIIVMLSHGIVSAALFMCVGVLYDRLHTKLIDKYGGVTKVMPKFAAFFMLFMMASIGLPGTSGFVGELVTMAGLYKVDSIITALSATSVILGAAYMLWLYSRVMFGKITNNEVNTMSDIYWHEWLMFIPIVIFILLIGIYPAFITDLTKLSVQNLLLQIKTN